MINNSEAKMSSIEFYSVNVKGNWEIEHIYQELGSLQCLGYQKNFLIASS